MNDDPLVVLRSTTDPAAAARAMNELIRAGFTDVEGIAADFGWRVPPRMEDNPDVPA